MTNQQAARKAKSIAAKLEKLRAELTELRFELPPAAENSEQEAALGAIMVSEEFIGRAASRIADSVRGLSDARTEDQIKADAAAARAEERRERTLRVYGCAS